ncbi:MAG: choice-of-anchor tandem repeat GloVer-containing protein, partial [Ferruginibacter sp.]
MKKLVISIVYLFAGILSMHAQSLYGTTAFGGVSNQGTLVRLSTAANDLTVFNFPRGLAERPLYTNFVEASDGRLFAMSSAGGTAGLGTIFLYDPATSFFAKVFDFGGENGHTPHGSLVVAGDGNFYGMTYAGGSNNLGVFFKFDPGALTYTKMLDFDSSNGANPSGNLVQAKDGKLYGMTFSGGSNNAGLIFSYDLSGPGYAKLKDLETSSGSNPYGSLLQATDGKLYGMTNRGGINQVGVIFNLDPSNSTYTKLKDFNEPEGAIPYGNLIQAVDGKLYGLTYGGATAPAGCGCNPGGVIFSFDPASSTYTKLKDFSDIDGGNPYGSLTEAGDGKLYGLTSLGGESDGGSIFSYDPATSITTQVSFQSGVTGRNPFGSFVEATSGILYGITTDGLIFSYDPNCTECEFKRLRELGINENGSNFASSVIGANNGKLYGMTTNGGTLNLGVVFSFDPSSSVFKRLADFNLTNGRQPFSGLVQATDGKIYGQVPDVALFSIDPATDVLSVLYKSGDPVFGTNPTGSMIQATDGKLYGMTTTGGSFGYELGGNGFGVIFSFDPSTSAYIKLKDFDNTNGAYPTGSLVQATDGKLYGTTLGRGSDNSTDGPGYIFTFNPVTLSYTSLMEFDGTNGRNPSGSLIQASDGRLYGLAERGGNSNAGVIFSFDPLTSTYTRLWDFDIVGGANPAGRLFQASDGKLYGMTRFGGTSNAGVIFSFDPLSSTYLKLQDYDRINGANPSSGAGFIELTQCINPTNWYQDADGDRYGNSTGSIKACAQPEGYVADSTDCDDNNKSVHSPVNWYQDADSDGYGNLDKTLLACIKPTGYVADSTDCHDNNNTVHATIAYYKDEDGDGFGNVGIFIKCCTRPTGYVADSTDCDDNDNDFHAAIRYFHDADGDGYGNPAIYVNSCTRPMGYVSNNSDCNDRSRLIRGPRTYYRDADRDGFGDANSFTTVCREFAPAGYVRNYFDCDDHKKANNVWFESIRMCRNGKQECVHVKDVLTRLWLGWKPGPCPGAGKDEIYSKNQPVIEQFILSSYPNPFAGNCTIKYELPVDNKICIKVFDGLGRSVATLVDGYKKAGIYTVNFIAGRIGNGTLYYRMTAESKN